MKDTAGVLGAEGNILLSLSQILIDEQEADHGRGLSWSKDKQMMLRQSKYHY